MSELRDMRFLSRIINVFCLVALLVNLGDAQRSYSVKGKQLKLLTASECFGNLLNLKCRTGHRIRVIRDWFGTSADPRVCRYVTGDCRVANVNHMSVVHRYCEGKQVCNSFQVDRRLCGSNQTNYEQVEYICVPDDDVIDMCQTVHYRTSGGHLSTPNFPVAYPPNKHCTCRLQSINSSDEIRLDFTHFLIKYDLPCRDWVEIYVNGVSKRLCGSHRLTAIGTDVIIQFHSDDSFEHQGLWSQFSNKFGLIEVTCHSKKFKLQIEPSEKTKIIESGAATNKIKSRTNADDALVSVTEYDNAIEIDTTVDRDDVNIPKVTGVDILTNNNVEKIGTGGHLEIDRVDHNGRTGADVNPIIDGFQYISSTMSTPVSTIFPVGNVSVVGSGEEFSTFSTVRRILAGTHQSSFVDDLRRRNGRATGIVIISVCIGGIILLTILLAVLLAVNKRKPMTSPESQRDHIQRQLNSLSFYDSIPLYNNVGPNGETAAAMVAAAAAAATTGVATTPTISSSNNMDACDSGSSSNNNNSSSGGGGGGGWKGDGGGSGGEDGRTEDRRQRKHHPPSPNHRFCSSVGKRSQPKSPHHHFNVCKRSSSNMERPYWIRYAQQQQHHQQHQQYANGDPPTWPPGRSEAPFAHHHCCVAGREHCSSSVVDLDSIQKDAANPVVDNSVDNQHKLSDHDTEVDTHA